MNRCRYFYLGSIEYRYCWRLQKSLVARKQTHTDDDYLLLVEHPDIVTVGRRYKGFKQPDMICVERGGEATLHNPGQLVAYPILKLRRGEQDVCRFVRNLEETIIHTLAAYSVSGQRKLGATGVWIGDRKIASIGVAISKWVTYHGIAINICNDLSAFRRINPCGFEWTIMTSLEKELGSIIGVESVASQFLRSFELVFARSLDCGVVSELLSSTSYGEASSAPRTG